MCMKRFVEMSNTVLDSLKAPYTWWPIDPWVLSVTLTLRVQSLLQQWLQLLGHTYDISGNLTTIAKTLPSF